MESEIDEHKHWNCPPVRQPRRNELPGDPRDKRTYEKYQDQYFAKHGEEPDSFPIEDYTGKSPIDNDFVKNHEEPVGLVKWKEQEQIDNKKGTSIDLKEYGGVHECSGTLISDNLFLTAGHSFVRDGGPPPAHVAKQMQVNFDYKDEAGELNEDQSYNVVELEELVFQHAGLDYAILRLDGDPGSEYETAEVAWGDAQKDDPLCIIGHPNGLPKRVVAGTATHLHDVRIGYDDINTAPGSSGAGILDGTGRLVGVHSESGIGINKGHNHGIRISAILSVSPLLRNIVEGPYKYESHSMLYDSSQSTLEPDHPSKGRSQQKGK